MKALQFASIICTVLAMLPYAAHMLELPNKMALSAGEYLTAQRLYRGWPIFSYLIGAAMLAAIAQTVFSRHNPPLFALSLVATVCIVSGLGIFFAITFPINRQTSYWTELPDNWPVLRRRWEYSQAAIAMLYLIAFAALAFSLLLGRV